MEYSMPGLHICDIATGGGKSYTIGKLTCEYYPEKFDRIIAVLYFIDLVISLVLLTNPVVHFFQKLLEMTIFDGLGDDFGIVFYYHLV